MCKIASEEGITPTFYSAFVVSQTDEKFVLIEMDNAGKSLGKWMETLAENGDVEEESNEKEENSMTEEQKKMADVLKKMKAEMVYAFTPIKQKNRISSVEAIKRLYTDPEIFYYQLFKKIKKLAKKNIAYSDTHTGNIMPNIGNEKGLQIIDFGTAEIMNDTKTTVKKIFSSTYNRIFAKEFTELAKSSKNEKSLQLINWFEEQVE
jgi:hypothetical protein